MFRQTRSSQIRFTGELRLWSARGLFLKMQPGHCIFYSYADWHPEKAAGALVLTKRKRLRATLVPDLRGGGNPISSSTSLCFARRQQRKVTRGFRGQTDVFSRSPTQRIKTESELGALGSGAVILAADHVASASGGVVAIVHLQTRSDTAICSLKLLLLSLLVIKVIC